MKDEDEISARWLVIVSIVSIVALTIAFKEINLLWLLVIVWWLMAV